MWEQIESNRRRTTIVVAGLGVILVAIGAAVGLLVQGGGHEGALLGALIALVVWAVMWIVAVASGDDIMLRIAGAREIEKSDHPQLWNVVEEMTIASSLGAMPRVYIVDDPAPNAFAVGRKRENAAVAVTTGLLALLDRNELQGVVAHEMAHVKNRDVALMTVAGVMIGSIVLIAEVGRRALWFGGGRHSRSSNRDSGGAQAFVMIGAIVLILVTPILAQLLYFSLSRRREYLADASAAMFTRYPQGLADALTKLGGTSIAQADTSKITAPMYIVRPLAAREKRSLTTAFSTHPPLEKRIAVLMSMGASAGLAEYERAYRRVLGSKTGVIGARSIAAAGRVDAVPVTAGAALLGSGAGAIGGGVARPSTAPRTTREQRMREASDAFLAASNYVRRECTACGATHKIPPALAPRVTRCTRCKAPLTDSAGSD